MKKVDQVKALMTDKVIITVEDICREFNIKGLMARRYLQQLGALSSINCGSSYYILSENHKFMSHGLLDINGKVFYRDGNLVSAATALIEASHAGMCISELLEVLKTSVHSQLPKLVLKGKLRRAKVSGVGTYIYLSVNIGKSKEQLKQRRKCVLSRKKSTVVIEEFDAEEAFEILVTMIKKPDLAAKGVALSLQRRGKKITSDKVKEIVNHFNISKKNF